MNEHGAILLAPSDIAELAGVTRAAVSNWRKRENLVFPEQAGGTASRPLFDKDAVIDWLRSQGKPVLATSERVLWEAINALRGAVNVQDAVTLVMSLACLRVISADAGDERWSGLRALGRIRIQDIEDAAQGIPPADSELVAVGEANVPPGVDLSTLVEAVSQPRRDELPGAVDYLIERATAVELYRAADFGATDSPAAGLLAALALQNLPSTGLVHDPACGIAGVLLKVLDASPEARGLGYEINDAAARRARQRARLAEITARLNVVTVDTLSSDPEPDTLADVVVIEPPFGLRAQLDPFDSRWPMRFPAVATEWAWVFHAVSHLTPRTGRGYILLTPGMLTSAAGRNLRAHLVENGNLHAVVALPSRMVPYTSIALTLCVVGPAGTAPDGTVFIDATESDDPVTQVPAWLRGEPITVPHAKADRARILAADSRLDPTSWIEWTPSATLEQLTTGISAALHNVQESITILERVGGEITAPAIPTGVRIMSVREMLDLGIAQLVPARAPRGDDKTAPPNLITGADIAHGRLEQIPGDKDVARSTDPGDVVIATLGGLKAAIDHEGHHFLGAEVHAIRIDPAAPVMPEYFVLALTGTWNDRFAKGTIPRAEFRDAEIPIPPPETQQAIVAFADRQAQARQAAATLETNVTDALTQILEAVRQVGQ